MHKKRNSELVECPECRLQIQDYELNQLMTAEERQEIEKIQIDRLIQINPSLKRCPGCGAFMEVEQGDVNYEQKDD